MTVAGRRSLRILLERDELLVMPGGFSPLYARMAEEAGFEAFFLAGSQVSAALYGVPDVGLIGLRDMAAHARAITSSSGVSLLVDGDTGYGNAVSVYYAVKEFAATGAGGVQFEDQEAPKKSGTGPGRRCVSIEEAVGKYQAAVQARDECGGDFVICARCDAVGAEGETFESALERCRAYRTDGGVDLVWLNSPQSLEQIQTACRAVPGPVLTTWGRPGPTPTLEQLAATGLRVFMIPTIAAAAAAQAAWEVLNDLADRGAAALDDWSARAQGSRWGRARPHELIGLSVVRDIEDRYLPVSAQRDYESTFGSHTGQADR